MLALKMMIAQLHKLVNPPGVISFCFCLFPFSEFKFLFYFQYTSLHFSLGRHQMKILFSMTAIVDLKSTIASELSISKMVFEYDHFTNKSIKAISISEIVV